MKRTTNGVPRFITYDDWNPLYEWDASGNAVAANMYGAKVDEIVGKWDPSLGFLFYKQDRHGNVVGLVNQGGTIVEKYRYDAFGQPTILSANNTQLSTSAVGNRFMFQGREYISELGIYDYRHRMYHPGLGHFLQTDPVGLQTEGEKLSAGQKALFSPGGQAPEAFTNSEMNLFRYCGDDPVDRTDPTGLVNLSYTPASQHAAVDWERQYNPRGFFTIAGHALRDGNIVDSNGRAVSSAQIVKDMKEKHYKPGTPILLVVCEAGKGLNSRAAQLAATVAQTYKTTSRVTAATTEIGSYRPKELPVLLPQRKPDADYQRTGWDQYDRSKPGKWQEFTAPYP